MFAEMKTLVFSRTLSENSHAGATIVRDNWQNTVTDLQNEPGKDIWLFGGGLLFQSMLAANLVDTVEVAVTPVLLGGGIQMPPPPATTESLLLTNHKVYTNTGIVLLEYDVKRHGSP